MYRINEDEIDLAIALEQNKIKSGKCIQFNLMDTYLFGNIAFVCNNDKFNIQNRNGENIFYIDMEVFNYIYSPELNVVCVKF